MTRLHVDLGKSIDEAYQIEKKGQENRREAMLKDFHKIQLAHLRTKLNMEEIKEQIETNKRAAHTSKKLKIEHDKELLD